MLQILKQIPFFSSLSDEDLQAIADNINMQYFADGQMVFEQGDYGEEMYIIKRGSVEVMRDNAVIAELSDHAFFGEMALVSDEPRNASVKAHSDLEVLVLKKEDFKSLLETKPSIATTVSYEVVKRANQL